jgi:serine-type D-Ala-D-Ala carboxypeptidase (penicillin-binding protein 5/6)
MCEVINSQSLVSRSDNSHVPGVAGTCGLQCLRGYIGTRRRRNEARFRAAIAAAVLSAVLVAGVPHHAHASALKSDLVDGSSAASRKIDLEAMPDVGMKEGALFDVDGRMLWARSPDRRRPMASITKVMTAVVVLEHSSPSDVVSVPSAAIAVGQSSAALVAGERLTVRELLEATLVKSGNDAAETLAIHVGGSEEQFVKMMNDKARDLGLDDTHFENAHGLDATGHYTTADDLGALARYAMSKPLFRDIVKRSVVTIGKGKRRRVLHSTDQLLGVYTGAIGIKTGNTDGAGYSIISAAKRGDVTLYAVVLGTSSDRNRFTDAKALLDWGFAHYRPMQLAEKGTVVGETPVTSYLDRTITVAIAEKTEIPVLDLTGPINRTVKVAPVAAPVSKGQYLGVAEFRQGKRLIASASLTATEDVARPNPFEAVWIGIVRFWRRVFG